MRAAPGRTAPRVRLAAVPGPRGEAVRRRPMRLTRRGRVVVVGLFAVLSLGGFVLGAKATSWAIAQESSGLGHEGLPWVIVEKGDTLWSIAAAVSPGDDPAATAGEIMRLNGLSSSLIRPGGRLYLPDRTP
ncbi:hypothetical protein GCM10010404_73040 [Nonomuraea africana]